MFPRDVTAAMMVSPTNPPGIELYSYANVFFCFWLKNMLIDHVIEHWSREWKHSIAININNNNNNTYKFSSLVKFLKNPFGTVSTSFANDISLKLKIEDNWSSFNV